MSAYDNGIEFDAREGSTRALRNRFTNTYATVSFQPIHCGPEYAIHNVVVNVRNEQLRSHGLIRSEPDHAQRTFYPAFRVL